MKTTMALAATAGLLILASAAAADAAPPAFVAAAVAAPDRPKADTDRDALRHPAELLAFAGIEAGQSVGDYLPGGGYFTRIFSSAVGAGGHVYALVPSELLTRRPTAADGVKAIAAEPAHANVSVVIAPNTALFGAQPLDVVWTSDNYHDVYNGFGPDQAAALDAAIFKALKPGGVYIVIDHVALAGTDAKTGQPLHRIDPAIVKAQVTAAGFVLEAESRVLADPADPHNVPVFDASIRGRTDQFVFKFRKPRS